MTKPELKSAPLRRQQTKASRQAPVEAPETRTLASTTYQRLRKEIIGGAFGSGERLNIRQLCDSLSVGLSPMREALNRLSMEGMVQQLDQRGFRVTPLDLSDLADLTQVRCWITDKALAMAIAKGDQAWEEGVIVALYRLKRAPRTIESTGRRNEEWELLHRQYHRALIAACGSQRWLNLWEELFDAADRYRMASRIASSDQRADSDEHEAITEAVLARDFERAAALLNAHVRRTEELIRKSMLKQKTDT